MSLDKIPSSLLGFTPGTITRTPKTSGSVGSSDLGTLIACTGTFTLGTVAAATASAGGFFQHKNEGTGVVTIDPNGSETIDGQISINTYPGKSFIVYTDGSNWFTHERQKGWVSLFKTSASALSSLSITQGFGDTEINEVELSWDKTSMAGDIMKFQLRKNGGTITTSTYTGSGMLNNGQTVSPSTFAYIPTNSTNSTDVGGGVVKLWSLNGTSGTGFMIAFPGGASPWVGSESTAAAAQGIVISLNSAGTFTCPNFYLKGFRS